MENNPQGDNKPGQQKKGTGLKAGDNKEDGKKKGCCK